MERPEGIEPVLACLEGRSLSHSAKVAMRKVLRAHPSLTCTGRGLSRSDSLLARWGFCLHQPAALVCVPVMALGTCHGSAD